MSGQEAPGLKASIDTHPEGGVGVPRLGAPALPMASPLGGRGLVGCDAMWA